MTMTVLLLWGAFFVFTAWMLSVTFKVILEREKESAYRAGWDRGLEKGWWDGRQYEAELLTVSGYEPYEASEVEEWN